MMAGRIVETVAHVGAVGAKASSRAWLVAHWTKPTGAARAMTRQDVACGTTSASAIHLAVGAKFSFWTTWLNHHRRRHHLYHRRRHHNLFLAMIKSKMRKIKK